MTSPLVAAARSYRAELVDRANAVADLRCRIQDLIAGLVPHIAEPAVAPCIAALDACARELLVSESELASEIAAAEFDELQAVPA